MNPTPGVAFTANDDIHYGPGMAYHQEHRSLTNAAGFRLKDYLPLGESVQSSVFELQEEVKQLNETIGRYKKLIGWGAVVATLTLLVSIYGFVYTNLDNKYTNLENNFFSSYMNLENKFFTSYSNLKDEIVIMNRSIGELQSVKQDMKTSSPAASRRNVPKTVSGSKSVEENPQKKTPK